MDNAELWRDAFDEVIVLSLPSSVDRRAYVSDHLAARGLAEFSFFDALLPDAPEVEQLIASDGVMQYPPCFRCGKESCGKPDCNNVLIGPQIAVFVSYLRLWRYIAEHPGFYLVVEDDVAFTPRVHDGLRAITGMKRSGDLKADPSTPLLLRLGWALSKDHDLQDDFRLVDEVKMSNPCHAMTSAYGAKLLAAFERVETTADVYAHRLQAAPDECRTLFPPIASELSWSKGAFQSLIHPKYKHAEWLEQEGRLEEAERARALADWHASKVAHRDKS
ncbi:glycosyltransferase family 25 protein [Maritimibacter alkaliphilus]|uniref:glycosyltransferase family 25 protein n=1 Tax=Maritimibacter alkaliphilus TaxID=404236 RepID=UPI001C968918|nr:glycosyltransferase family 25 protein [Maritimibacter alkaliphilus]MBY6092519.1 glycosyltransferase family 25 protein [Maritimibacter alkaliphilus]